VVAPEPRRSATQLSRAPTAVGHTAHVQVTSQCRVDAPVEWVRAFLLAGTADDDVTVDGDVVEVRQRDRMIHLVVRNTLHADAEGGTQLDVDAQLRLLGIARIVGGVFRGRVRRTLERSLDRLPTAIEQALAEQEEPES
jgi:carbon monoxide dehydrogenase subunit G